jgi:hypothetical protein
MGLKMTPEQITDFVLSYLMMRGKPTEDGSLGGNLNCRVPRDTLSGRGST